MQGDRLGVETVPMVKRDEGPKVTLTFRLSADTRAALEQLAEADDRTLGAYIDRVLREHVATVKRKR